MLLPCLGTSLCVIHQQPPLRSNCITDIRASVLLPLALEHGATVVSCSLSLSFIHRLRVELAQRRCKHSACPRGRDQTLRRVRSTRRGRRCRKSTPVLTILYRTATTPRKTIHLSCTPPLKPLLPSRRPTRRSNSLRSTRTSLKRTKISHSQSLHRKSCGLSEPLYVPIFSIIRAAR